MKDTQFVYVIRSVACKKDIRAFLSESEAKKVLDVLMTSGAETFEIVPVELWQERVAAQPYWPPGARGGIAEGGLAVTPAHLRDAQLQNLRNKVEEWARDDAQSRELQGPTGKAA